MDEEMITVLITSNAYTLNFSFKERFQRLAKFRFLQKSDERLWETVRPEEDFRQS